LEQINYSANSSKNFYAKITLIASYIKVRNKNQLHNYNSWVEIVLVTHKCERNIIRERRFNFICEVHDIAAIKWAP